MHWAILLQNKLFSQVALLDIGNARARKRTPVIHAVGRKWLVWWEGEWALTQGQKVGRGGRRARGMRQAQGHRAQGQEAGHEGGRQGTRGEESKGREEEREEREEEGTVGLLLMQPVTWPVHGCCHTGICRSLPECVPTQGS